ncbi:hypothetical protein BOTCAL_0029g00280 [Botryotinia calthae]|uniref:Uncharacterized protein n=1 Tax=Botryotinia calthae TaxID=38488 RepID=A0A4Y8DG96_9HELO|nr:hypothetical protein BOTCAL_0029g00280 [Botryotinia calthae]
MLISPTVYQKKYGAPPTPIAIIIDSHRSGLAPISAYNLANPSANFSRDKQTAYKQSKTPVDFAWVFSPFEELPGVDIVEEDYENGFEEWLDNWTKSLNNFTEVLDVFGANLLNLIESLKFVAGGNDRNLERYYNYSIDTYWASRRKLSPESDYANDVADNESSAQRIKPPLKQRYKEFECLWHLWTTLHLSHCSLHKDKLTEYARGPRQAPIWLTRNPTASYEELESTLDK